MKRKQKLGYIILGAGILAIGIIIGQFVTPDIEAQSNGVFDKIQCREIEVIDKDGETAIRLYTTKHGGDIRMDSKDGRIVTMSIDENGGSVYLFGKGKGDGGIVSMHAGEDHASLGVRDRVLSDGGIWMYADDYGGRLDVKGKGLFDGGAVYIRIDSQGGGVEVSGNDGGSTKMGTDEHGGRVDVFNNQGKNRAVMGVNEYGNGAVSTWDRNGYRQ